MRIRWRLPLAFILGTLIFAGIVALVAALALRGEFLDRLEDEMSRQAHQYVATLETLTAPTGTAELQRLTANVGSAADARFTVIDSNGWVLADSEADPASLENHSDRPEVRQALAGNEARERRDSATLGKEEVYVAIPLPAGQAAWSEGVVRIAQPASQIDSVLAASWRIPLIVWAALLLPTLALALLMTRSITKPLERLRHVTAEVASGDLTARTGVLRNDELGELSESFNVMAAQLETREGQLGAEMERTDRILAAMTEGVLLVDASGHLLRSNPAAEQILGAVLAGTEGTPLVLAARSFPAQALAEKAHGASGPLTEVMELPGGRSLTVDVIPLRTAAGPPAGKRAGRTPGGQTLFVVRDETVRRATERMRRDFATNVSHELKTPLAGLSLLADTLRDAVREDPEQAEKFVDRLSTEVGRLSDLTNDLLTLSRLEEAETLPGSGLVPVDLVSLVATTAEEMRTVAEAKQHTLTLDKPHELVVEGDSVALRTLVRNLLDNAIRYTEPGGHIALCLRDETDPDGRRWAVLSVTDNGVGIPQHDQKRVFERFYRVDKARSRETGGTGLGLSIVRHVAERHGGRVELQSTLDVGSTFTVRLPLG
ncbi:MAG: HAMP domain-containing protein [Thermoleophilia bacterium]|nr:HAMP domain-containing protein [Thermoleophilia bacterium]